jgi:alcohol dehydrogenase (NADP+)
MANATIKPKVHQFELHPYLQQADWVEENHKYGITVTGYAPLGNTNPIHTLGVSGSDGNRAPPLFAHPVIKDVAAARSCSPAQVVLAWNMRRKVVVIPKAAQVEHQKENIVALDRCKITDEDAKKIDGIRAATEVRLYENICRYGPTVGCSQKSLTGRLPGKI